MLLSYINDILCHSSRSNMEWFYKELVARFECKEPQWLSIRQPLDHLGTPYFRILKAFIS